MMHYPRFSITMLVLTAIVAAYLGGRQATLPERDELRVQLSKLAIERLERWEQDLERSERRREFVDGMQEQYPKHSGYVRRIFDHWRLRLVAWNVESGGNDPETIAGHLFSLGPSDIIGLTEVSEQQTGRYLNAMRDWNHESKSFVTDSGGGDRMMLIYNASRLDPLEHAELDSYNGVRLNDINRRHRSPLMVRFKDRVTQVEFIVVLNHLARGNAELRQEQAKGLRLWAADQTVPIIGIGDYNFDYDFPTSKGNAAFDEFVRGDTWRWVMPIELIDTNWSDPDGDGVDNYPHSCLDFMFVAGAAKAWHLQSRVLVWDGDFPDDEKTSDHRPVELVMVPE